MKFSELLGDEQPAEVPSGSNGRPSDVPALGDDAPAATTTPADAFDRSLDAQLDALPGPEAAAFAPEPVAEPTPVRFSEPEPYQPEPEPYQPEPAAVYEPVEPAAVYEPVELTAVYEAPESFAPYEAPESFAPLESSTPELQPEIEPALAAEASTAARPTTTSVFGGGRVEAQSSGLASLNVPEAEEAEAVDDAMRIARLDVIDDDILPTTRRRSRK